MGSEPRTDNTPATPAPAPALPKHHEFFQTDHLRANLKQRSIRGGVITVAAQVVKFVVMMASTVTMARLLSPSEYGLVAMVTPIVGFVSLFKDLGLSLATIQKENITHEQISSLFWFNVAASLILGLICAAISPLVGWLYGDPKTMWITLVSSAGFIFGGLAAQHSALLSRQMRFGTVAAIDVTSLIVLNATGVVAAYFGASYWSLIAMNFAGSIVSTLLFWIAVPWRPAAFKRGVGIRTMVTFGSQITGVNVLNYLRDNIDRVIIGRFLGAEPLGLYNRAFGILMMPTSVILPPIVQVILPALSRLNTDREAFRRTALQVIEVAILAVVPVVAVTLAVPDLIVEAMLGKQWAQVVPIFRGLSIIMYVFPATAVYGVVIQASGRSDVLLRWAIKSCVLSLLAILLALPWGLVAVAYSYALVAICIRTPWFYLHVTKCCPLTFRELLKPLFLNLIPMVPLAALAFLVGRFVDAHNLIRLLLAGITVLLGFAGYLAVTNKLAIFRMLLRRKAE